MLYPLTFHPIFQERIWGGRELERLYHKPLPPDQVIGESWEISDRPNAASVVANGPLAGRTLRWLMEEHRQDVLGTDAAPQGAFPLLVKILDARDTLSVQVHPPAPIAAKLGGQPKTEMWYVTDATPEACLYAGLKRGVGREDFERHLASGTVAECLHRIPVGPGACMFLPSGRLHAIGGGNVLFEIQQNSDTTYRVFDWNRAGLDGKPRELHVAPSLASIDFDDHEPGLIASKYSPNPNFKSRYLVNDPLFRVDILQVRRGQRFHLRSESAQILGVVRGRLQVGAQENGLQLEPGQFSLVPACLGRVTVVAEKRSEFLHIQPGDSSP